MHAQSAWLSSEGGPCKGEALDLVLCTSMIALWRGTMQGRSPWSCALHKHDCPPKGDHDQGRKKKPSFGHLCGVAFFLCFAQARENACAKRMIVSWRGTMIKGEQKKALYCNPSAYHGHLCGVAFFLCFFCFYVYKTTTRMHTLRPLSSSFQGA